jgi:preprotein translocase subunit SecD
MKGSLRWKWLTIVAIVLLCVYGIIGVPKSLDELKANWAKNIRLGLDLKGGSHLVLQVQYQDAFKAEADAAIDRMKEELRKANVDYASIERNEPSRIEDADKIEITVKGVPPAKAGDFRGAINQNFGEQWNLSPSGNDYKLNIKPTAALKLKDETLKQSMATIDKKINGLGVAEATVQQRGGNRGESELLVQLPGVDDPARIKQILKTAALLELFEVKDGPVGTREELLGKHGGVLPVGTKMVKGSPRSGGGNGETWWLLNRSAVVTGRDLKDARPAQGEFGRWETNFVLSQEAAKRFERFTESNIGNRLAIVLDNVVLSAPTIQNKISDNGRITGANDQQEASDLALNLRAGSLPASVEYLEERTVGPSLGADSIRRGLTAGIVSLILVIAAMIIYYKGAGVNAVLALLLNTLITIAALAYFDAVWTLPGIAGLVLSIGMAVDSNVLIFERIKEELRLGKAVPAGIAAGFGHAFITILDTHVTTVVSSAFLFIFGTGPIRGFAVTLVVGLLANMFTAVFVSRAIFDVELARNPRMAKLSI